MLKKLNFLLIASAGPNQIDLVRAITKAGHAVGSYTLDDVTIKLDGPVTAICFGQRPLSEFDIIIPRSIKSNLSLGRFILQHVSEKQFVLDQIITSRDIFGKIAQGNILLAGGLQHPKTFFVASERNFPLLVQEIPFPCIAKPVIGSQGYGVTLIRTLEEAREILRDHPATGYIFQEYLPISFDYRILVIGNQAIGGIKRNLAQGDVRTNASVGGVAEVALLTDELRSTAIKAASLLGYDLAGVDIAVVGTKHYVFEVNRSPQWQAFKEATTINPEEIIVNYSVERFCQKTSRS